MRCSSIIGFSKSSGCGSFMLLRNGDRGLAVDKAAQFFGLAGGNAKPKWRGWLIGTRVGRVRDGIDGVAGVGQTNPAHTRLIFTGAETDAFTIRSEERRVGKEGSAWRKEYEA